MKEERGRKKGVFKDGTSGVENGTSGVVGVFKDGI